MVYICAHDYLHTVNMMRYLFAYVWSEQNTEINVHVFENASDNRRKKQVGNNIKLNTDEED